MNLKYHLLSLVSIFLFMETIMYLILGYYFFTDSAFYTGEFEESSLYEVQQKLIVLKVLPILLYLIIFISTSFLIKSHKAKIKNLLEFSLIVFLGIILYRFFDIRTLIRFVHNHVLRCFIAFLVSLSLLIFITKYFKINPFKLSKE